MARHCLPRRDLRQCVTTTASAMPIDADYTRRKSNSIFRRPENAVASYIKLNTHPPSRLSTPPFLNYLLCALGVQHGSQQFRRPSHGHERMS